jgi:hypothetical protein
MFVSLVDYLSEEVKHFFFVAIQMDYMGAGVPSATMPTHPTKQETQRMLFGTRVTRS